MAQCRSAEGVAGRAKVVRRCGEAAAAGESADVSTADMSTGEPTSEMSTAATEMRTTTKVSATTEMCTATKMPAARTASREDR